MFLTETYSELGRSTAQHLDGLRRQLGVGLDPAYDYSHITEMQKKLTQKKDKKLKDDVVGGGGALDELRKALMEASGGQGQAEEPEGREGGAGSPGKPGAGPPNGKKEQKRPSRAFLTTSREYLESLDVANRFRAPPVGSYRPRAEVCERKVKEADFGMRPPTKGLATLGLEREVARLQAEKQPYDHLLKQAVSVELLEDSPERVRGRLRDVDFAKSMPRPDLVKAAGIVYHDNSFTAGVLDGDLLCSHLARNPSWDFAKTSTAEDKPHENFFQPGQYKVNVGFTRPSSEVKNIPFQRQTARKPLREVVGGIEIKGRAGDHLPDRSLSRSCPILSNRPRLHVPIFDKYKPRSPFIEPKKPYHRADDPEIDRAVLHHGMTYDAMEASKATWRKPRTVEKFDGSLDREEQFRIQRSYGEDIALQLAKENTTRGPVSVELLPDAGSSEILRPHVVTADFARMRARDVNEKRYTDVPPRQRDQGDAMKFERGVRAGDARLEPEALAASVGVIARKRASRRYDALEAEDAGD